MNINRSIEVLDFIDMFRSRFKDEDFSVNDNGELCDISSGEYVPIANFSLVPETVHYNENGEKSFVFLGIIFDGRTTSKLNQFKVPYKDLATKKWLKSHVPFGTFVKESSGFKSLKNFLLRAVTKALPEVREVNSAGWHDINGKLVYVHSGGVIGDKEIKLLLVDKNSNLKVDNQLPPKQAFRESLNMLNMCESKLSYALLSLLLVSVKTSPLINNGLAPKFSVWIEGKSGMGKTSIAKLFTQIFESPKIVHAYDFKKDITFNISSRDCVSIIDDYGVDKTKRTADITNEKVEKLIRDIGDREQNANFSIRPEGMLLFTGEKFLSMGNNDITSSAGRVVRIPMDNIFDKTQVLTYSYEKEEKFKYFEKTNYLSTSITFYLEWLSRKFSSPFFDNYRADFESLRQHFGKVSSANTHSRQKDSLAHLAAAFRYYLKYGQEREFITTEEMDSYHRIAIKVFEDILRFQSNPPIDTKVSLFLEVLEILIKNKKIKIVKRSDVEIERDYCGILDIADETLSLSWQEVYDKVVSYIHTNLELGEFISDKMLGKLLWQANLIYRTNEKTTKSVNGLKQRAIQFNTDKISDLVGIIEEIIKMESYDELLNAYSEISSEHY
ncbi:hypothetical protein ACX93W_06175 [Paenibacillus sp. CAU 1782]